MQNPIQLISIEPPPKDQQVKRQALPAKADEKRNRYHLPSSLQSESPIGYRTHISMSAEETKEAEVLFSLEPPTHFTL